MSNEPKEDRKDNLKKAVATNPTEIDGIIRDAYGNIYVGNVSDGEKTTEQYF